MGEADKALAKALTSLSKLVKGEEIAAKEQPQGSTQEQSAATPKTAPTQQTGEQKKS